MKLNIYENKKIAKTYEAETYDLMFGTVEDLINAIDLDKLETGSDVEIIQLAGNFVMRGFDTIKPLLMDIFDGLTEDELKRTKVSEIASVLIDVVKFAIFNMGTNGKN